MPPGNHPQEPAGAGSHAGTASAVFHFDSTSSWVYLIWRGNDEEPIPLIQTSQDDNEQTRRKFFPMIQYILDRRQVAATNAYEDTLRKQYTSINQFFEEYDVLPEQQKLHFALNAEKAFLVHLEQARNAAQARARELGVKITRLLVPFPSTWTRCMQTCYAAYFRTAWKLDPEFIHESKAIAHLVSKSMMPGSESRIFRTLIIVDLGAQLLSMSTFHLAAHRTNPANFHLYSEPNSTSVESSIDLHGEPVGSRICSYMTANGHTLSESDEETESDEEKLGENVTASHEDADKTKVVLVGVGFQNKNLREEVEKQVKAHGFLLHKSSDFCRDTTQPSIAAVGAARAIVNASSVEEFMQTACFVVRGLGGIKILRSTIWSNGSSKTARVSVLEKDAKLIIKCSPVPKMPRATGIDEASLYKFSELPLPCGEYDIRMNFQAPPTNDYSVTISYKTRLGHADDGRETKDGSREYRMYYDYGSRMCFEDIDQSASRDDNDQAAIDLEEPEELRNVTVETHEARILARTRYRVAASRATLSAL